ncbi:MAG: AMP-binding protein [Oligoflexia bacterium]|nr:AMP-binding protein [Oligoflexia bacterium]
MKHRHQNLTVAIQHQTENYGSTEAFILKLGANRFPVSFTAYNELVRKLSHYFQSKFKPGFRVALWGENSMHWCALAQATWHAGGTLVPLMHIATEHEVRPIMERAEIDMAFVSPLIHSGQGLPAKETVKLDQTTVEQIATNHPAQEINGFKNSTDDLAVLIFTSGTTGNPKGVMLTHRNILTNLYDCWNMVPGRKGLRGVSLLPLSHMFELVAGFTLAHMKGICFSYPQSLKTEDVLSELKIQKSNMLVAVPLLFEIMDRTIQEKLRALPPVLLKLFGLLGPAIRRFPFLGKILFKKVHDAFGGHMMFFCTGGAKIDPEIIIRFQSMGFPFLQGYGLTETSPILTLTTADKQNPYSVGIKVPSVELKIFEPNETGEGEIIAKGPSVFQGYYKNPEATAEVIKDGWFHTGDIGKFDEQGFLYITGRKKDIIVTPNGKNVYPEELEEVLKSSPLFVEATVIGLQTSRGEAVGAVIVPSPNLKGDIEKLVRHEVERLTQDLADYKQIQEIILTQEELPKTPTKKVKKHLLKQMIQNKSLKGLSQEKSSGVQTPLPRSHSGVWLSDQVKAISKQDFIWLEAELKADLGLDSLTFMELIGNAETHFGIKIPDEKFSSIRTVDELLKFLPETSGLGAKVLESKANFDYKRNNTLFMNGLRLLVHGLLLRPLMKIMFGLRVKNIPPSDWTNIIITPNHSSHLDLPTVLSSLPLNQVNRTYAVAADDYFFDHPLKAWLVRLFFNAIPFERKARIDKGFKVCLEILAEGGNLVIFPEGTRSVTGQLAPFKPGVGLLLAGRPYKALPCRLRGVYEAFPKGAPLPKPGHVEIRFGELQSFASYADQTSSYPTISQQLQQAVEKI